jgi:hypothetical protein
MQADNTALLAAEANPDIGMFVDAPHAGAPLVIAFGFADWQAPGRFDFARRLRKLEQADGQPLNLAFGPLSYLRSDWARRDDDTRWLAVMEALDRFPPPHRYDDLPALLDAASRVLPVHLVYGTGPDADGPPNRDDLHARRYAAHPAVRVETIPEAGHAVVEWLIARDRIDDVVRRELLIPLTEAGVRRAEPTILPQPGQPSLKAWDDGWRSWIAENLALGGTEDSLLSTLVESGFHAGEARREIYKVARSPYLVPLARLLERTRE